MSATEKALREALELFLDLCPRMLDDDPIAPALADACRQARAALSLPETVGEPVGHVLNEKGLWGAMMQVYLPTGTPLYAAPPSQPAQGEPVAWVECDGELVWQNKAAAIGRNLYTRPSVPAGMKLVPVEPTEAVLRPFYECPPDELRLAWAAMLRIAETYRGRAMLAAAPPSQPAQGCVNLDVISRSYGWTVDDAGMVHGLTSGDMGYEPTGIVLAAAPAAPTNGEGV